MKKLIPDLERHLLCTSNAADIEDRLAMLEKQSEYH